MPLALKGMVLAVSLLLLSKDTSAQSVPTFLGRKVTLLDPGLSDEPGMFPKGPATVCIEGPPQRQCYTAPGNFGGNPSLTLIQVRKNLPALFFRAAGGGVSGFPVHFALLHPRTGKNLENLFPSNMSLSNQSQTAFWVEPPISDAQIFVTAEYNQGLDEGHYGAHRYIISVHVLRPDDVYFDLEDQYLTVRYYDLQSKTDILGSEKSEILARLARVKKQRTH